MIEVRGTLINGGVYLAGELVRIEVCFSNLSETKTEMIAVACAEIHCQCSFSEQKVRIGTKPRGRVSTDYTSFDPSLGEKGFSVLSTPPAILLSNLSLAPLTSRTVYFCEHMPGGGPPSFRGAAVKYAYKLTVGVQRPNSRTYVLRVPLRVLDIEAFLPRTDSQTSTEPLNPFLTSESTEDPVLTRAVDNLMAATSRQRLTSTVVTRTKSNVAVFSLFKSVYRIGEDIVGIVDFSNADLPCYSMAVHLRSKEKISEENRTSRAQPVYTETHSSQAKVVLNCQTAHINLAIPVHSTPSFSTSLMELTWHLEFEFQLAASVPFGMAPTAGASAKEGSSVDDMNMGVSPENRDEVWRSPERVKTETMLMSLPINVVLTTPAQASQTATLPEQRMKF